MMGASPRRKVMSQRWRSLSVAMMLLVAPLVGVAPAGGQSEEGNSFRSWNFPDHYIRHRDNLGRIDKIVTSDKLGRKDGTFRIVADTGWPLTNESPKFRVTIPSIDSA